MILYFSQKDKNIKQTTLSAIQSILEEYTLDHNISIFRYSSLALCYKSTNLVSCHQKDYGISFSYFFRQIYSGKIISVVLMYRKHTESVWLFYERLENINAREETDVILWDFNLNAQDLQEFQCFSSILSNFQLVPHNCTHLNGSHISQVFVAESFLWTNIVNTIVINTYFSTHAAVCVNLQHL